MESAALVSGEYGSGDENTEQKRKKVQSDVNYEEVGMDMGSSSSEPEDDVNNDNRKEKKVHQPVCEGIFSSKKEYEAYQNQFKEKYRDEKYQEQKHLKNDANSEYGGNNEETFKAEPRVENKEENDNDEYGRCQPSSNKKPKLVSSREASPTSAREPHRRNLQLHRDEDNLMERIEAKQKQPNKRPSVNEEKLKDKLLSMSQEEPSSSGSERGDSRKHCSPKSRSRSRERSRKSGSPKPTSRKRSRSRSHERKKEHDRHRSSHHRSSKHHHHRDHRDRERHNGRDRERNYRSNDGRRNRDRISEEQRQKLRNKKLVNLGITSNAVLAAASQSGSFDAGSTDDVAMRAQLMISKQLEAQVAKAKEVTGVELPSYYNPSVINPIKYADQIKKRKLLWGSSGGGTGIRQPIDSPQEDMAALIGEGTSSMPGKSHDDTMQARKNMFASSTKKPETKESFNKWETTNFGDDKANEKFRRFMGIKSTVSDGCDEGTNNPSAVSAVGDKTTKFFKEQEFQYERARAITHTQRGKGFGFLDGIQQQQNENPGTSYPLHGNSSDKPNPDLIASNSHKGIGEKLGFVKKSF